MPIFPQRRSPDGNLPELFEKRVGTPQTPARWRHVVRAGLSELGTYAAVVVAIGTAGALLPGQGVAPENAAAELPELPTDADKLLLAQLALGQQILYVNGRRFAVQDGENTFCITNPAVVLDSEGINQLLALGRTESSAEGSAAALVMGPAQMASMANIASARLVWSPEQGAYVAEGTEVPVGSGGLIHEGEKC
jgi:hypothetical protein